MSALLNCDKIPKILEHSVNNVAHSRPTCNQRGRPAKRPKHKGARIDSLKLMKAIDDLKKYSSKNPDDWSIQNEWKRVYMLYY